MSRGGFGTIAVEMDERGVTRLVLSRVGKRNALSAEMIEEHRLACPDLPWACLPRPRQNRPYTRSQAASCRACRRNRKNRGSAARDRFSRMAGGPWRPRRKI